MEIINLLPKHYIEHTYFNKMFSYFDQDLLKDKKIIVSHDYKKLPEYGKHIIAILTAGDEKGTPPIYKNKVGIIFKHHLDHNSIKNVFHIPLPYVGGFVGDYSIPINQRKYDVFFVGRRSRRKDMLEKLTELQSVRKDLKFCVYVTGHKFMKGWPIEKYSKEMMNSKIVLSPRGAVRPECLRFTEAVKCGCAVVTCKHPAIRVFKNCPAVYIDGWNQLKEKIDWLLSDKNRLIKIHNGMKKSWDDYFSPQAVAYYINKIVRTYNVDK